MLKVDWLRHPATGVAAFALIGLGAPLKHDDAWQPYARSSERPSAIEYQHTAPVASPGDLPAAPHDRNAERHKGEHESQEPNQVNWLGVGDLGAQWIMALATIGILGLTGVGVGILRGTLKETERAAQYASRTLREAKRTTAAANRTVDETVRLGDLQLKEAQSATKAAINSAETAREIGEVQSRAYPTIQKIELEINKWGSGTRLDPVRVIATVQNSGQSPAVSVIGEISCKIEVIKAPEEWDMKEFEEVFYHNRTVDFPDIPSAATCELIFGEPTTGSYARAAANEYDSVLGRVEARARFWLKDVFGGETYIAAAAECSLLGSRAALGKREMNILRPVVTRYEKPEKAKKTEQKGKMRPRPKPPNSRFSTAMRLDDFDIE